MARGKYQRRGQQPVPPHTETQGVEPVSTDALNTTAPATPAAPAAAFELYADVPAPKMVAMELLKNYRPSGAFEIVGYTQPAVVRKNAAGQEVEVEPKRFIAGEAKPSAQAGVGIEGKIWAGTVIRLTEAEARTVKANGVAERGFDD